MSYRRLTNFKLSYLAIRGEGEIMINGKLFAKFQKILPKMNKALKAKNCTPNAFFMAE